MLWTHDLIDMIRYGKKEWSNTNIVISEWKHLVNGHHARLDKPVRMILYDNNEDELCFLTEIPDVEFIIEFIPKGVEIIWKES